MTAMASNKKASRKKTKRVTSHTTHVGTRNKLLSNLLRVPTCAVWLVTRLVFFRDGFLVLAMAIIHVPPSKNVSPLP